MRLPGRCYEESLVIRRELGDRGGIADSLEGLASVVAALGDSLRAARIWGAAERLREEIGSPLRPMIGPTTTGTLPRPARPGR